MNYYEVGLVAYDGFDNICIYKSVEKYGINDCVLVEYRNTKRVGIVISNMNKPNFECKSILETVLRRN